MNRKRSERGGADELSSKEPVPADPDAIGRVTLLLDRWAQGDREAYDRLIPIVHDELRRLASRYMRGERTDHTLQTTALLNEAYLRLRGESGRQWSDRRHFFAVAARAMRQVLVDHARSLAAGKRGGGLQRLELVDTDGAAEVKVEEVIAVHDALERLAELDRRQAEIVELRFFAGLTVSEIADLLGLSEATVAREWRAARAWLRRELDPAR